MLEHAKSIAKNSAKHWLKRSHGPTLSAQDVQLARLHIAHYWKTLERHIPKDESSILGLPKPYLVPAYEKGHAFDFNELYYWDSYFMAQGLLDKPHRELVLGILENLFSLFKRFGVIPNASRTYLTGRSQPPMLTSFIFDVYNAYNLGLDWLEKAMDIAKQEYEAVWMSTAKPHARQVYQGLSRYYDINVLHDLAETESGWDHTPRFNRQCLNYLPIDLNSLLYKYETDFAATATLLGNNQEAARWQQAAATRKRHVDYLMWDKGRSLYYDYNYVKQRRGVTASLAAFCPLWAGMVSPEKAKALVKSLRRFEQKGGLATTDSIPIGKFMPGVIPTQWAYPNGWAPLHFFVVRGLQRYGYHDDAQRIAFKWLRTNLNWFTKHNVFLEKYNVVSPDKPPVTGVYPTQVGFGWTNAIFERFCRDFIDTQPDTA